MPWIKILKLESAVLEFNVSGDPKGDQYLIKQWRFDQDQDGWKALNQIELKTNEPNCGEIAKAWREVNTSYYDGSNQGNFTPDGKLMIGYICE